ncbi:sensor histidine kinase [Chitinophaga agri]|uniref:histidine kinase n=1 Tax=Chitinophaga agri TaxID=2703787 RepID=A0A6B9ZD40_9BACT|nr:sensor histidine kinase [Chitinophaga agri]QHS59244.1 sensor histidine kinase [Chitinophaga agri]
MKRFLVQSTGNFLYGVSQGRIDKDSAMIYSCDIYQLSKLTPYNEDYKTGKDYPGQALIDAGKVEQATQLLNSIKGTPRLQLLAELGNYYLHRAGADKDDLAAASKYANLLLQESTNATDPFWQVQAYWLLGNTGAQARDLEKSQGYFVQAVALCRKTGNEPLLGRTLLYQADALPPGAPQKENIFREVTAIAKKHHLPILEHRTLSISSLEHLQSNPALVEKEVQRLMEIQKEIGFLHNQFGNYTLSFLHLVKADAIGTLKYTEMVMNDMVATKDTAFSAIYCMRQANLKSNTKNYDEALYWCDRALSVPLTKETQLVWYRAFIYRVSVLRWMDRPAAAVQYADSFSRIHPPLDDLDKMLLTAETAASYEELGNEKMALENYLQFLDLAQHFPPHFTYGETMQGYSMVANFYLKKKAFGAAKQYASLILAHPLVKSSPADLARAYTILFKVDSATGNYASAISNLQQYQLYTDSVYSLNQRKAMDALTVRYETQKKDQDIRILKQDSQLQKAQLSRSSMIGRITLGGIALLLIIVGLLYNQYRIKRKSSLDALARNTVLQQLLDEKEWLLREVHHRVKNNLQTIVSLLESQSAYLENDALLAIQESQNRIHAMSLIHQKLYHDENVSSVNMGNYLPELIQYLRQSYNVRNNVCFNVQVDEIELDVSQAIPLGLIVNEAITNAIKYAFPRGATGQSISVALLAEDTRAQLYVADNGIGIKPAVLAARAHGLGLKLIRGLAKDIEAELNINGDNGTTITISFEISQPLGNVAREKTAILG